MTKPHNEFITDGDLSIQRTIAEAMAYNAERRHMYRSAIHPDVVFPLGAMATPALVELREHTVDIFVQDMFEFDDEIARRETTAQSIVDSNEDPASWPTP